MKARLIFAWYDLWVGFYWDSAKDRLYFLPVPCFGLVLQFPCRHSWGIGTWREPGRVGVWDGRTWRCSKCNEWRRVRFIDDAPASGALLAPPKEAA